MDKLNQLEEDRESLYNKGIAYYDIKRYEKAIAFFTKAIEIDSDKAISLDSDKKAIIYAYRGLSYYYEKKYVDAINDYDSAIELKRDYGTVYNNRGLIYSRQKKYEDALKDYNKAIELSKDKEYAYNNRGTLYRRQNKINEAIKDYDEAIKLNPNYATAYGNRGFVFSIMKKFKESNSDLIKSIYLYAGKESSFIKKIIYQEVGENYIHLGDEGKGIKYFILAKNDPIEILGCCDDIGQVENIAFSLINNNQECRFNKIIASVKNDKEIVGYYKTIYLLILQIIYTLLIKKNNNIFFAHYATREVASQLIFKKSPFRLNSALTVNDPTEGETLLRFLGFDALNVISDNRKNKLKKEHDFQAFIGCFSFNEDSLNQFRLYGKENSMEATGISIVLNDDYFNSNMCLDILPSDQSDNIKEDKKIGDTKFPIFRCLYLDPNGEVISLGCSKDNDKIKKDLETVKSLFKELKDKMDGVNKEKLDKNIINNLFLTLKYLVKHSAFKEEQECRVICIKDVYEDAKKIEEERDIHFSPDLSQMYVNYSEITDECLEKVIFGPKAQGFEIFKEALIHKQINCECKQSDLPFA